MKLKKISKFSKKVLFALKESAKHARKGLFKKFGYYLKSVTFKTW